MNEDSLSKFERDVLCAIVQQYPNERAVLEEQLNNTSVRSRENSGAGWFTKLNCSTNTKPCYGKRVLGHVFVEIEVFRNGLGFVLFLDKGRMSMLEGFSYSEETKGYKLEGFENTDYVVTPLKIDESDIRSATDC